METKEENRIMNLLKSETEKINPGISAFSSMLEKIKDRSETKKRQPILSKYFTFEKRTLIFAGSLALAAFIMIMPQLKTNTDYSDADDLVSHLTANSADEDDYLLGSGESITLSSFDAGTSSDITNLSI